MEDIENKINSKLAEIDNLFGGGSDKKNSALI